MKINRKIFSFIMIDLLVIIFIVVYFGLIRPYYHPLVKINGVLLDPPKKMVDFQLLDTHGNTFSKKNLQGRWSLLFFGFTQCPSICPTTLDALNKMYLKLQHELPAKQLPQVVFISVDPQDTIQKIKQYTAGFNPHFTGAKGNLAETNGLEKQLSITVTNNGGTINHTADIILINPTAEVRAYFVYPHQPEQMANDYKIVLKSAY